MKTKVVHSQSKSAWNVVGEELGGKYKICRCPYYVCSNEIINERNRKEALSHALFISKSFKNFSEK